MAISRRHARSAVERNRVKRLIREAFRRHRPDLPGLDVVVMLRASPRGVPNPELRAALERLFGLLGERRSD
jgi:ribonuclease P protein component